MLIRVCDDLVINTDAIETIRETDDGLVIHLRSGRDLYFNPEVTWDDIPGILSADHPSEED